MLFRVNFVFNLFLSFEMRNAYCMIYDLSYNVPRTWHEQINMCKSANETLQLAVLVQQSFYCVFVKKKKKTSSIQFDIDRNPGSHDICKALHINNK